MMKLWSPPSSRIRFSIAEIAPIPRHRRGPEWAAPQRWVIEIAFMAWRSPLVRFHRAWATVAHRSTRSAGEQSARIQLRLVDRQGEGDGRRPLPRVHQQEGHLARREEEGDEPAQLVLGEMARD